MSSFLVDCKSSLIRVWLWLGLAWLTSSRIVARFKRGNMFAYRPLCVNTRIYLVTLSVAERIADGKKNTENVNVSEITPFTIAYTCYEQTSIISNFFLCCLIVEYDILSSIMTYICINPHIYKTSLEQDIFNFTKLNFVFLFVNFIFSMFQVILNRINF